MTSKIPAKEVDFAKWYSSILKEADLFEYGFVKGTIILKPYANTIWENIKSHMNKVFAKLETQNCVFPTFIPYSEFLKEAQHIEGFAPELFKIAEVGDKTLADKLVLRPTSEIAFCNYFSKLALSYSDLPLKLNQWSNAFRVEKNTKPFLRTSEFFWQEQHCIFASENEARNFSVKMIEEYAKLVSVALAIPVIVGLKTEYEKFAGAVNSFTIETLMQDGQALQAGTSHYLGTNFSKQFGITFQDSTNEKKLVHQTSAGISTRLIGALILAHSDNKGLVLPSKVAPYPIVFNVFNMKNSLPVQKTEVYRKIKKSLTSIQHLVDASDKGFGTKINKYEVKGVPIQILLGQKEVESGMVTIYKRSTSEKISVELNKINSTFLKGLLKEHDRNIFDKAKNFLETNTEVVTDFESFKKCIENKKMVLALWAGDEADEKKLKELTGASSRCIMLEQYQNLKTKNIDAHSSKCFFTQKENPEWVYFARAY